MVRLAPLAVNMQPWRILRIGSAYHFYLKHSKGYANRPWDIQKIDMGIALCHFMTCTDGRMVLEEPDMAAGENMEYMATVIV